jgi:predicted flap endonuclease-1-like 5' DNA nuclease
MNVLEIEGVGATYAEALHRAGIRTDAALLQRGATRKGRAELAEMTRLPEPTILEWVNHADLMRIHGVGPEYADLLEEAGVDTVPELAHRNPVHLHETIEKVAAEKELVRRPPSEGMVAEWIAEATTLRRMIEY